jgi:sensor histidine kinase regulating citrate/malate metabolism
MTTMTLSPKMELDHMSPEQQLEQLKETLWGGPDGEGLVHSVAKLAVSVTEVTNAIRFKMDVAHDENGDPISLRTVSLKVGRIEKLILRGLWALAGIGLLAVLVSARFAQLLITGKGP